MHRTAYDPETLTLVVRAFDDQTNSHIPDYVRSMEQLAEDVRRRPGAIAQVMVIIEHGLYTSRGESQRIMEVDALVPRMRVAFVAPDAALRSFALQMQLLARSGHERTAHSDPIAAMNWFDECNPGAAETVIRLLVEVGALT